MILRRGLVLPRILLIATTIIFQLPFRVPHSPCSEPLPLDSCLPSTAWPTFLPIFESLIWFLVPFHSLLGREGWGQLLCQTKMCLSFKSHNIAGLRSLLLHPRRSNRHLSWGPAYIILSLYAQNLVWGGWRDGSASESPCHPA